MNNAPVSSEPTTGQAQPYPLISIIVPIYKVEPYLRRCVDSILTQTYKNIEVILVDDGSPDNCPAICDEYERRDGRVCVLHKLNEGLLDARNAGISVSNGELIGFVDGDDYIAPRMYEKLYAAMAAHTADLVICGYIMTGDNGDEKINGASDLNDAFYAVDETSPLAILNLPIVCWVSACTKLYRRDVVIPFPLGKFNQDAFVAHHIISKCERIATIHDGLYYYVQRSGSIIHTFNVHRLDGCEAHQDCYALCKTHGLKRAAGYALITTAFICLLAFTRLHGRDNRKKMWCHIRWVFFEILKHPTWFLSVFWCEAVRYRRKEIALKS